MVAIGDVLAGRYTVEARLGQGGMAAVFRARDQQLGRAVAIKVLHQQFSEDPELVARFQQEARAAAGLSHPHIVEVYDVGTDQGALFIVMALATGENLGALLAREGRRSPQEVARIGSQIAEALAYAHRNGVIHRDVKPQNILLDPDGRVRLADFGIAEIAGTSGLTQSGWVMGTAYYLSPERAQGESGGATSDIYSLGVVLYEALAGRRPFSGANPVAIALQQLQQSAPRLADLAPDAPTTLIASIERAMAYAPNQRYATADELARDLRGTEFQDAPTVRQGAVQVSAPTERAPAAPSTRKAPSPARPRQPLVASAARGFMTGILVLVTIVGSLALGAWLVGTYGAPFLRMFGSQVSATPTRTATAAVTVTRTIPTATAPAVTATRPALTNTSIVVVTSPTATRPPAPTVTFTPVPPTPALVEIPNVVGRSRAEAEETLRRLQLGVTVREVADPSRPVGVVLTQSPAPGQRIERGGVVNMSVNRPPASPSARVPNVEGMDEREARRALEQAGFKVDVGETQVRQGQSKGTVVNQVPDSGATVEVGSLIRIEIGT
ncbi:MAG: protein kinase domain-containing protein [Chloroflexota bacterium]